MPAPKVQEALHTAVDTVTDLGYDGMAVLTSSLARLAVIVTAVQNGEFNFNGTLEASSPANPVLL